MKIINPDNNKDIVDVYQIDRTRNGSGGAPFYTINFWYVEHYTYIDKLPDGEKIERDGFEDGVELYGFIFDDGYSDENQEIQKIDPYKIIVLDANKMNRKDMPHNTWRGTNFHELFVKIINNKKIMDKLCWRRDKYEQSSCNPSKKLTQVFTNQLKKIK